MSTTPATPPALRTKGLSMSFGGLKVLQGLNLEIQQGEKRSIIGPNGAGKTTLFNILSGAFAPTSGTWRCSGTTWPAPARTRSIVWGSAARSR